MSVELGGKKLVRVFAKHDPYWDTGHLGKVMHDMLIFGAPTIRVVEYHGDYFAIEGSHRLYAAHIMGLPPTLVVEPSDRNDPSDEEFLDIVKQRLPHYTWIEE